MRTTARTGRRVGGDELPRQLRRTATRAAFVHKESGYGRKTMRTTARNSEGNDEDAEDDNDDDGHDDDGHDGEDEKEGKKDRQ